jgi:hypothetical protein
MYAKSLCFLAFVVILACVPVVLILHPDHPLVESLTCFACLACGVMHFGHVLSQDISKLQRDMQEQARVRQEQARVRLVKSQTLKNLEQEMFQKRARAIREQTDEVWNSYRAISLLYREKQ